MSELLQTGQIVVSVFAFTGAALLGYMLRRGSDNSHDKFSTKFLQYAAIAMLFIAIEVAFGFYRAIRMPSVAIPLDAGVAGFLGRLVEAVGLWSVIGYLVRGNGQIKTPQ